MSKKIVICCDGTGNRDDDVEDGKRCISNVRRFYELMRPPSKAEWSQVGWYDAGVGTGTSRVARRTGTLTKAATWIGAKMPAQILGISGQIRTAMELGFGIGISENIADGYGEIVRRYVPRDEIFLIGFSRGAYTARCIAGVIARCGLLRSENLRFAEDMVRLYRYRKEPRDDVTVQRHLIHPRQDVKVKFLGLWDTVASLGVPLWGWWFRFGSSNKAFDTSPAMVCEVVRHALSIDEERSQFFPMLFNEGFMVAATSGADVEQVWFRGSHAGVGGGYADCEISDGSLLWMIAQAKKLGLEFDEDGVKELKPNYLGYLHNQLERQPHWVLCGTWPRWHPCERDGAGAAEGKGFGVLDESVHQRAAQAVTVRKDGALTSEDLVFLAPGKHATVTVRADKIWNRTGVVLEHGFRYTITYEAGRWEDKECGLCSPEGQVARRGFRRFLGRTKRFSEARWMELIGHVAHPRPWPTQELPGHQLFEYLLWKDPEDLVKSLMRLGRHLPSETAQVWIDVEAPSGMFYAFANDAWLAYPNNSGAITLDVKCEGPIPADGVVVAAHHPRFVVASNGHVRAVPVPPLRPAGSPTAAATALRAAT